MKRASIFLVAIFLAVTAQVRALNPFTQQWVQNFHAPYSGDNLPIGVAVDGRGNAFVAGSELVSNAIPLHNFVTLKYSPSGVPLWTNYFDGPAHLWNQAYGMALDHAGNVFVTGITQIVPNPSPFTSYFNYVTIKYSNNGAPLWTNYYNGLTNANDQAQAIAVDPASGAACVTGFSIDTNSFQYVTIKYSNAGTPLWTNAFTAAPTLLPNARLFLAVGKNGTVFVSGQALGQTSDYVTLAYSGSGVPLWTNFYDGTGHGSDWLWGMAVDKHNRVFVTGTSTGTQTNWDFATIAYSGIGVPLWTNRFHGPVQPSGDFGKAIAVNDHDEVFVTGITTLTNNDFSAYATVAYSGAGIPLWTNYYTAITNSDQPYAIATEFNRGVFVTGFSFDGTVDDISTLEYSTRGKPLSTNFYSGATNGGGAGQAIAVGPKGEVYVTGYSIGTNGLDITTIKYSPTPGPR